MLCAFSVPSVVSPVVKIRVYPRFLPALFVYLAGLKHLFPHRLETVVFYIEPPVETGAIARMAGAPLLLDFDEQRIPVAVDIDPLDVLDVAGGFPLEP